MFVRITTFNLALTVFYFTISSLYTWIQWWWNYMKHLGHIIIGTGNEPVIIHERGSCDYESENTMKRMRTYIFAGILLFLYITISSCTLINRQYAEVWNHNEILKNAMVDGTIIEIKCIARIDGNASEKVVKVTDYRKIKWLLTNFQLPAKVTFTRSVHACIGHLRITIYTAARTYVFRYDHGFGQYPISFDGRHTSYVHMDPKICNKLNQYFKSLGFTDKEIGINNY